MENPEEILQSLEEFSKLRPKDIPRELEDYLLFVAKTGDPIYQWSAIKSLFREKLLNVIAEFYESCPSVEIPPCPNVDIFNYEIMKAFILEKLDTFSNAPFTIQRICELLTTPRKEYNRIDKYMRALEKNILVVSTTEPGVNRRNNENGANSESFLNGLENAENHANNSENINIEEVDESWANTSAENHDGPSISKVIPPEIDVQIQQATSSLSDVFGSKKADDEDLTLKLTAQTAVASSSSSFVSIEPVISLSPCGKSSDGENAANTIIQDSVTITAVPAQVQKRRDSIEPLIGDSVDGEIASTSKIQDTEMSEAQPQEDVEDKEKEVLVPATELFKPQTSEESLEAETLQMENIEATKMTPEEENKFLQDDADNKSNELYMKMDMESEMNTIITEAELKMKQMIEEKAIFIEKEGLLNELQLDSEKTMESQTETENVLDTPVELEKCGDFEAKADGLEEKLEDNTEMSFEASGDGDLKAEELFLAEKKDETQQSLQENSILDPVPIQEVTNSAQVSTTEVSSDDFTAIAEESTAVLPTATEVPSEMNQVLDASENITEEVAVCDKPDESMISADVSDAASEEASAAEAQLQVPTVETEIQKEPDDSLMEVDEATNE